MNSKLEKSRQNKYESQKLINGLCPFCQGKLYRVKHLIMKKLDDSHTILCEDNEHHFYQNARGDFDILHSISGSSFELIANQWIIKEFLNKNLIINK